MQKLIGSKTFNTLDTREHKQICAIRALLTRVHGSVPTTGRAHSFISSWTSQTWWWPLFAV